MPVEELAGKDFMALLLTLGAPLRVEHGRRSLHLPKLLLETLRQRPEDPWLAT